MAQAPLIRIDAASATPVQRQIVDAVRVLLVDGSLPVGAVLPSVRRMAIELGIHFNTVVGAYRELAAEGWLYLQHGRGARVIEKPDRAATRDEILTFRERLRQTAAQMRSVGVPAQRIAAEFRAIAEAFTK